jgi:hypothetical protein
LDAETKTLAAQWTLFFHCVSWRCRTSASLIENGDDPLGGIKS